MNALWHQKVYKHAPKWSYYVLCFNQWKTRNNIFKHNNISHHNVISGYDDNDNENNYII